MDPSIFGFSPLVAAFVFGLLQGAALMGAFGLGTLPTVLATGVAARRISGWIRNPATRTVAALLIITFATWQLWHLQTMVAMG